jgi:hypothetical protein
MTQDNEHRIELSGYDSPCSTNPTYGFAFLCAAAPLRECFFTLADKPISPTHISSGAMRQ